MPRLNPLAVARLRSEQRAQPNQPPQPTADIYCYLQLEGTNERFDFILNPSSIDQKVAANYESLPSAGTNIPRLQYRYGEALQLTLNGLILMSPQHQASLQPLLDAGVKLTRCDPANQKFAAPVCSFVWGTRRLESCVVTGFDFSEKMWNSSGFPVHAEGSMTLIEVLSNRPTPATPGSTQQVSPKLSSRELEAGSKGAIAWIKQNPLKLPSSLQQRVKLGQYRILTNPQTRAVAITDSTGKTLSTIGTNERGTFKPKP
ncbi:MAG: hypothetical protein KME18_07850 [Phormidium tanganyikae FI6-MK23]|jgi:hypothetical protein|nr:hypothetical protein [Phormidium tanganyikae FI6-MK23]